MAIVTWAEYNSLFSKVTESEFPRYEKLAENEVRAVIGNIRWEKITPDTYGYDVLKDCICNTIDKLKTDEMSGRNRGIKSVSNDGYSETYETSNSSNLKNETISSIKGWLSGTGLVGGY